jgi:NAD(P)-dependent dehydrogenase (short-subunit alcohol dehydrogenase family)
MKQVQSQRPAVLVTGVSSGIGLAIAEDLLQCGYQVFGSVRKAADAQALCAQWCDAFVPLVFDVTDTAVLPQVVAQVQAIVGDRGLKALVNNAGIIINGPLMHQPLAEIRQTFDVNVFGTIAMTQAFLPLLGARPDVAHAPGRIVNISSVSGSMAVPFMGAYAGSKHALEAITQGFRRELMPYGIEAVAIQPGFIRSRLVEKSTSWHLLARYGDTGYAALWRQFIRSLQEQEARSKSPDVVTRAVRHAIEAVKPRTRYPLDGIWHVGRWLPDRGFDRLIFKAMGLGQLLMRRDGA